jgi:mono/diheme cytochrome c family protein
MPVRLKVLAAAAFAGLLMAPTALMLSAHSDDGDPIEGRKIFLRDNCYSCHGNRAEGGMCPNLRNDPPDESDVEKAVREGKETGMPPFPDLTDVDVRDLAAYFESLGTANEPTFTHWWEPGVPTR